MNTQSKDFADQTEQESNIFENAQGPGELIDGREVVLVQEDDDLQLADGTDDRLDMDGEGDDVIELTDMVEEPVGGDSGSEDDEVGNISLNAESLEEEEIIELVDAVRDTPEAEEEVLELTDLVEDETFQPEPKPKDEVLAEKEHDEGLVSEDLSDQGLSDQNQVEDMEIAMEKEDTRMPGVEAEGAGSEPSIEMEDIAIEEEESEADKTIEEVELVPEAAESYEVAAEPADSDGEEAIIKRLSDEKIESIITRVVKEAIEEKADRILLEVAEAAIAKEIEKIKKAL